MKGSRFSEEQIMGVLREHEAGAEEVCRLSLLKTRKAWKSPAIYHTVCESSY
jgi:hypothetical protein